MDVLFDGRDLIELRGARINTVHRHGTGCTFAVAAALALGRALPESALAAKRYVERGLRRAPRIGRGRGPFDHFERECPPLWLCSPWWNPAGRRER